MSGIGGGPLAPEFAFALIGILGVGSQWLAWRLRFPGIVMMFAVGLVVGPFTGILNPARDIGALVEPMMAMAVAIILFEGGLTLNAHKVRELAGGVRRLVLIGAPLGWAFSTLALHHVAGLDWPAATVLGGIMIVTGPTVIAPLLRQARLARRPALLLQWEAIINDPIGALAAVLAYEIIALSGETRPFFDALVHMLPGVLIAGLSGFAAGHGVALAFRRGWVPEYMKVSVLFVAVLAVFALTDAVLEESGLLAVTVMGVGIANARLQSYGELRRFKENATVLLVSGVFILLAAGLDMETLRSLDWRALAFVAVTILVVRPATVLLSLAFSDVPWKERILVALTGPRGVVLVAVSGLFAAKLVEAGVADGARLIPLAFALVAATVVLHGFTLAPMARWLGLAGGEVAGILLLGGSRFTTELGRALTAQKVPVLVVDPNWRHLRWAREAGVPTYYGDILSEAAEERVELVSYGKLVAATDNDAYNTLVATDIGMELGRDNVWQIARAKDDSARHALPATLGGRGFGDGLGFHQAETLLAEGWRIATTRLSDEYPLETWRKANPDGILLGRIDPALDVTMYSDGSGKEPPSNGRLIALLPPEDAAAV